MERSIKFRIQIKKKLAVVIHVDFHADNTEFSHFTLQGLWAGSCLFAEDGTEITKN